MAFGKTDLSVAPPSVQIGSRDDLAFDFAANQDAVSAAAFLRRLDRPFPPNEATAGVAVAFSATTDTATVRVDGPAAKLEPAVDYLLSVVFTRADGTDWTRTLVLEVVA